MKVLIVEDNKKLASAIKQGLEQENYTVDTASDGEYGLDLAATEPYDVIILDIMLPKIDGVTLCKKLRTEEKDTTPIIMLTAKRLTEDKINGLNAGADDYLTKPFSFDELLARIKALTRRPKNMQSNILKLGDLKIDRNSLITQRSGKLINLSKREFSLLEYLVLNKGKIVSKEQIISNVWEYDADILNNTVEAYIGRLRKKIEKPFKGKKIIQTIRGFGYKVED